MAMTKTPVGWVLGDEDYLWPTAHVKNATIFTLCLSCSRQISELGWSSQRWEMVIRAALR